MLPAIAAVVAFIAIAILAVAFPGRWSTPPSPQQCADDWNAPRNAGLRSRIAHGIHNIGQPALTSHALSLANNQTWETKYQTNFRFGAGLELLGLQLASQTGYNDSTKLKWVGNDKCKQRRLYSVGMDPTQADIIFAKSWGDGTSNCPAGP